MPVKVISLMGMSQATLKSGTLLPFIYVGRPMPGLAGHQLANPYKVTAKAPEEERRECLDKYRVWLDSLPSYSQILTRLAEQVRRTGLPLACWCGCWPEEPDLICHAVELAVRIEAINQEIGD